MFSLRQRPHLHVPVQWSAQRESVHHQLQTILQEHGHGEGLRVYLASQHRVNNTHFTALRHSSFSVWGKCAQLRRFRRVRVRFPPFSWLHLFGSITSSSSQSFWWPASSVWKVSFRPLLCSPFFLVSSFPFIFLNLSLSGSLPLLVFFFLPLVSLVS